MCYIYVEYALLIHLDTSVTADLHGRMNSVRINVVGGKIQVNILRYIPINFVLLIYFLAHHLFNTSDVFYT
jgi:hypothetical protein